MGSKKANASLIAEAAEWRLLSLLMERPRPGWHAEVGALAHEVRDRRLRAAADAATEATEGTYLHALGPGGAVSPREVSYQPFQDPGHLLAQLATAYAAFAFHPRTEDPMDHLAVETDFVGYLLLKEAFAAARGDEQAVATIAAARRAFVATHVSALAAAFAERLQTAGPSYLAAAARCLATRVPAPPPRPAVGAVDVDDLTSGCGACGVR